MHEISCLVQPAVGYETLSRRALSAVPAYVALPPPFGETASGLRLHIRFMRARAPRHNSGMHWPYRRTAEHFGLAVYCSTVVLQRALGTGNCTYCNRRRVLAVPAGSDFCMCTNLCFEGIPSRRMLRTVRHAVSPARRDSNKVLPSESVTVRDRMLYDLTPSGCCTPTPGCEACLLQYRRHTLHRIPGVTPSKTPMARACGCWLCS
jgi:hypothetical protein